MCLFSVVVVVVVKLEWFLSDNLRKTTTTRSGRSCEGDPYQENGQVARLKEGVPYLSPVVSVLEYD